MKTLSNQAQVAKLCRKFLKEKGIKASVRSSGYSMGDSVDINVEGNVKNNVIRALETEFSKYEMGRFDGMADCYEFTNKRNDIPQTKYLFVNYSASDELRNLTKEYLAEECAITDDASAQRFRGQWLDNVVYRELCDDDSLFWSWLASRHPEVEIRESL